MTWVFLVSAGAVLAALSNISLKHGLTQIGILAPGAASIFQKMPHLMTNPFIWLGVIGLGTALLCWLTGLSQVKLNTAYPILVGLEYTLVMVLSWLILGEAFVSFKLAGIVMVFIGIVIITY